MLYLYICLSYEKFVQCYNIVDENEKELIISLIHQNQTIEYIFVRNNIGKIIENSNNKDEVMSLINNCKYFSDADFSRWDLNDIISIIGDQIL